MFFYFIIFFILGIILGIVVKNHKIALGVIGAITLCWAFVYGAWALATFLELMLGFGVARVIQKEISK